jgi:hypothetical protein
MHVASALKRIVSAWAVPTEVKAFILQNSRIVIKKGQSIGSIVLNYRKICRSTSFPLVLHNQARFVHGSKGNEPTLPPSVQHILRQHADFVPSKVISPSACVDQVQGELDCVANSLGIQNADLQQQIRSDLDFAPELSYVESDSDLQLRHFLRCTKVWLHGHVASVLDKNNKCMFVEPLLSYASRMERTFLLDPHYKQVSLSEDQILQLSHDAYSSHSWKKLGKLHLGALGYAYVLPKNKDPCNKERPIVPSTSHPLKRIFNIAARVLIFLLSTVKIPHFNILATKDLKDFAKQSQAWCHSAKDLIGVTFDVKNMFTELQHGDTLEALTWFLNIATTQFKYSSVIATRSGRKDVSFSRNMDTRTFVTVPLHKLFDIAKFELENTFFKVGSDVILHQKIGIAMGGFQSPALAMIVASHAEFKWLSSLGIDQKRIKGARYVDDALVLFRGSNYHHLLDSLFLDCYPKSLELECTGLGTTLKILECDISLTNGFSTCHSNPNTETMILEHQQKFLKFIPWSSHHPRKALSNTILGLLHRVWFNTSYLHSSKLLPHLISYHLELLKIGYPASCFKNAAKRFLRHERIRMDPQFSSWQLLLRIVSSTDAA